MPTPARGYPSPATPGQLPKLREGGIIRPAREHGGPIWSPDTPTVSRPYADIKRTGRWKHQITIRPGDPETDWLAFVSGYAYGRKRAERKARKLLRRYLRKRARNAEPTIRIYAEDR